MRQVQSRWTVCQNLVREDYVFIFENYVCTYAGLLRSAQVRIVKGNGSVR